MASWIKVIEFRKDKKGVKLTIIPNNGDSKIETFPSGTSDHVVADRIRSILNPYSPNITVVRKDDGENEFLDIYPHMSELEKMVKDTISEYALMRGYSR